MKRRFSLLILIFILASGCAGQTIIKTEVEFKIKENKTAQVVVETQIPGTDKELEQTETVLIEKLKSANIFSSIVGKNQNADFLLKINIEELVRVSKSDRFWLGALAGRAKIAGKVTLVENFSGRSIGSFYIESTSSGGTIFAGTTEDAINKFADDIVKYLLEQVVN
ncbi:MAG: hypothetical protein RMI30_07120 [Thermodesulfovibrio sp.]|nr:hypothetical protein [Thermodesulfovibrio sp.]MDW7999194.1 hypothetical protein [Thermodesulfovibrio sp.]